MEMIKILAKYKIKYDIFTIILIGGPIFFKKVILYMKKAIKILRPYFKWSRKVLVFYQLSLYIKIQKNFL